MNPQTRDPTAPINPSAAAGASAASERWRAEPPDEQTPTAALRDLSTRFSELGEYVSYYLAAKADGLKVTFRNVGILAALGIVGAIAGAAFVTTAVVLVCVGVALALAALFNNLWAGALVAGVLFLALLGVGAFVGMRMLTRGSKERTVKKYASRKQQQRTNFGTDVHQRAESPAQ